MDKEKELLLRELYNKWAGEKAISFIPLQPSGSYREYYRIIGEKKQAIGVYNANLKENKAFLQFTKHFLEKKVPVPQIYAEDLGHHIYLLEDLGDTTLFAHLFKLRKGGEFPQEIIPTYKDALSCLAHIQVEAGKGLDYSYCYPRARFDEQSIQWDLNYFKYYFLRLAKIPFDEQLLEHDFEKFQKYLLETNTNYFLYRDFQARNIMLYEGKPYFIDYQGGRKGALQYDLASLLYQAKANIPEEIREELLLHYMDEVEKYVSFDREEFRKFYYAYVLIRTIQVLGAYGFRGFYERKPHFLESIPFAIKNLKEILRKIELPIEVEELKKALIAITESEELQLFGKPDPKNRALTVSVSSFSYKNAIPEDPSGNGGGFIFDCRAIHNPGRYDPYKKLTGRDRDVIDFLKKNSKIDAFLMHVYTLVDASVEKYLSRGFTHLMVNFGCTGGQHRSVYCADQLAAHLEKKYDVTIKLNHIEQERKNWQN
ncbi:MAG: RNase adapter RapZ [Bacteroidota bacterium]